MNKNKKQIIAITGPSFVGKTTLTESLLDLYDLNVPRHTTTREKRIDDKPGFYNYLTYEQYLSYQRNNAFLLSSGCKDIRYGILKKDCDSAFLDKNQILINISYKDIYQFSNIEYPKILIALTFTDISKGIKERAKLIDRNVSTEEISRRVLAAKQDHNSYFDKICTATDLIVYTDKCSKEETLSRTRKVLDRQLIK